MSRAKALLYLLPPSVPRRDAPTRDARSRAARREVRMAARALATMFGRPPTIAEVARRARCSQDFAGRWMRAFAASGEIRRARDHEDEDRAIVCAECDRVTLHVFRDGRYRCVECILEETAT